MAMNSHQHPGKGTLMTRVTSPFIAGSISGALSTVLFQPFDLVKTRMQMRVCVNHSIQPAGNCAIVRLGTMDTFLNVVRRETVFGLWRGLSPSLQRCVPGIGVYFGCMETFKRVLSKSPDGHVSATKAFLISSSARGVAAVTFLPITVVKARYESGMYSYRGVYHALSSIWAQDGVRGLYRGLSATLARDIPFSSVYYVLYSQSTQHLKSISSNTHLDITSILACGFGSGLVASVLTQPFDVIKTKVQVSGSPNEGIVKTFRNLTGTQNGLRGLYSGLTPRVLRRTFMAAFTWMFYEEIQQFVVKNFV